jgi:hypothetical protein
VLLLIVAPIVTRTQVDVVAVTVGPTVPRSPYELLVVDWLVLM